MYNKLLKIEDLELSFKMYEGISYVLKKINLDLNKGEKVALVGESGSGKSVTTKLILGLLNQKNVTKKGKILFNDRNILNLSQNEFKKIRGNNITIIFQDPIAALNPVFKIKDQFYEVNLNDKKMSKKEEERGIGDNQFPMADKLIQAKGLILKSISRAIGVRNNAWSNKNTYTDKCFNKTEEATDFGLDAYNLINDFIREELNQEPDVKEGLLYEVEDAK